MPSDCRGFLEYGSASSKLNGQAQMRRLSSETLQLLRQLYQPEGLLARLGRDRKRLFALLLKIEERAEPLAIPGLLPLVVSARRDRAVAAARVIHTLLAQCGVLDLVRLDERVRDTCFPGYWQLLPLWREVRPSDVARLRRLSKYSVSVLGACSFHGNGYVREKAVRQLASVRTGEELPFLLIRLNDWVSEVCESAQLAVQDRLHSDYAAHFVRYLPIVLRLANLTRVDQSAIVSSITTLLQQGDSQQALLAGLELEDRFQRRACFQIALDARSIELEGVIERGIEDVDNLIRLWSTQRIGSLASSTNLVHT